MAFNNGCASYTMLVSNRLLTGKTFPGINLDDRLHTLLVEAVALYENYYLPEFKNELNFLSKEIKRLSRWYGLTINYRLALSYYNDFDDLQESSEFFIKWKECAEYQHRIHATNIVVTICSLLEIFFSLHVRKKFIRSNEIAARLYEKRHKKTPSKKNAVNWFLHQVYLENKAKTHYQAAKDICENIKKDHFLLEWLDHLNLNEYQITPPNIQSKLDDYVSKYGK